MVITDELREACAWVAGRATHVRIVETEVDSYALGLGALTARTERPRVASNRSPAEREEDAAFWLTLDAINFGSGWFPTLRKRRWVTGYRTIEGGLRRRFDESGPWAPRELVGLGASELAGWLDQDPDHELIQLFAGSLNDLGTHVERAGSFTAVIDAAGGSALTLVETLSSWDCYRDVSIYEGHRVPFLKRAQIAAADLDRAGVARFGDLRRLTIFADNLVPHVLRLDGVLRFDPDLVEQIERGELIPHDSGAEIEIRACAVHAVELVAGVLERHGFTATAAQLDEILWNRGQGPRYKRLPRHRSRTTAY